MKKVILNALVLIICLVPALVMTGCVMHHPVSTKFPPASAKEINALQKEDTNCFRVEIRTEAYKGGFLLDGSNNWFYPDPNSSSLFFYLGASRHTFDVAKVDGSAFSFDVTESGKVTNISNQAAAEAHGQTLVLHTKRLLVDPGPYGKAGGAGELTVYPEAHFGECLTEPKVFSLVPNLVYAFDNREYLAAGWRSTSFYFFMRADGSVITGTPAAWASGRAAAADGSSVDGVLALRGALITVVPPAEFPQFQVGANSTIYSGTTNVPVLMGLWTAIHPSGTFTNGLIVPKYANPQFQSVSSCGRKYQWRLPWDWNWNQ